MNTVLAHNLEDLCFDGKNNTFILFSPSATSTGKYNQGLQWLGDQGFKPVFARWIDLGSDILPKLYPRQCAKGGVTVDIARIYFDLDQFLLVLLEDIEGDNASARLRALKGHAIPDKRPVHCLRNFLGSDSRMLNLVHSPDNHHQYLSEKALFLDHGSYRDVHSFDDLSDWQLAPVVYHQACIRFDATVAALRYHVKQSESINYEDVQWFFEVIEQDKLNLDIIRRGLLACGYEEDSMRYKWALVVIGAKRLYG